MANKLKAIWDEFLYARHKLVHSLKEDGRLDAEIITAVSLSQGELRVLVDGNPLISFNAEDVDGFKIRRLYTLFFEREAKEIHILMDYPQSILIARWSPLMGLKQIEASMLQMFRSERDELVMACMKEWNDEMIGLKQIEASTLQMFNSERDEEME